MVRRSSLGLRKLLEARRELLSRQNELLEEFVERIARRFPKSTIILFGSRGRGEERPDSDYDLLVVMDIEGDRYERIVELRSLKPRGISVDLLILSPEEIEDPYYREMLRRSAVLYNGLDLDLRAILSKDSEQ
ncbi:MAG: nucleotidyltransferase domain-containing protein [Candidatus Korarchaeota archaeon]|nr:nucleotidyltransferase domain-containing protein [Candidatus Korarchaeota archaeon]